jgi:hypothetical protein
MASGGTTNDYFGASIAFYGNFILQVLLLSIRVPM